MTQIIALKGVGNSGKTTTINLVFSLLKNKYPNATINTIKKGQDIKIIMDINGKKVGIESQGDPNSRLKQSLRDFFQAKCDIIICATRTRGMTVNWVKSYSNGNQISFINQTYASKSLPQQTSNNQMANKIIKSAGL